MIRKVSPSTREGSPWGWGARTLVGSNSKQPAYPVFQTRSDCLDYETGLKKKFSVWGRSSSAQIITPFSLPSSELPEWAFGIPNLIKSLPNSESFWPSPGITSQIPVFTTAAGFARWERRLAAIFLPTVCPVQGAGLQWSVFSGDTANEARVRPASSLTSHRYVPHPLPLITYSSLSCPFSAISPPLTPLVFHLCKFPYPPHQYFHTSLTGPTFQDYWKVVYSVMFSFISTYNKIFHSSFYKLSSLPLLLRIILSHKSFWQP